VGTGLPGDLDLRDIPGTDVLLVKFVSRSGVLSLSLSFDFDHDVRESPGDRRY